MSERVIVTAAIQKKLKTAQSEHVSVYIGAPIGYGKTAVVHAFYKENDVVYLSGENGALFNWNQAKDIQANTVVIDDISWITDEDSRQLILGLIQDGQKNIVMMGRSKLPDWLQYIGVQKNFMIADERDLMLGMTAIEQLLDSRHISLPLNQIRQMHRDSGGYPLSLCLACGHLGSGRSYDESVRNETVRDLYHYWDQRMFEQWPPYLQELLVGAANFDSMSVEMGEFLTGSNQIASEIEYAMSIGNFLRQNDDNSVSLLPHLRQYLLWKQSLMKDPEKVRELFRRAALYYELHDQILPALQCCEKAGDKAEIRSLLIKNAQRNPGAGYYFELRRYYLDMPEEEVKESPVLIAALSMVCSLMMQPEESERWFSILEDYAADKKHTPAQIREAKKWIFYLQIALPHRGSAEMADLLKNAMKMVANKEVRLPEFSVTSNQPSIISGGKDFCEWTHVDRQMYATMRKPAEMVLGRLGKGLAEIALAESLLEKGGDDLYEIMTLLNTGYAKADLAGSVELCFVADANLAKMHILKGQPDLAMKQLQEFEAKIKDRSDERMMQNLQAMEMWIGLLQGDLTGTRRWLENDAPQELKDFTLLERYRYLMKIRAYLADGNLEAAQNLAQRLSAYFREYHRTYMDMENEVLRAIVQYRVGNHRWKQTLTAVLPRLEEYHFLFLAGKEGIALRPLLEEMGNLPVSQDFAQQLRRQVNDFALHYPRYLEKGEVLEEKPDLTAIEKTILRLYCQGVETQQICDLCGFTYNTLKFHNRNLYRKLGVSSRAEAERKAREFMIYTN